DPGDRLADRADPAVAGVVGGGDRRGLGEAVALVDGDPEVVDELGDRPRDRYAAAHRVLEAAAEAGPDIGEGEAVEGLELQLEEGAGPAADGQLLALGRGREGGGEDPPLDRRLGGEALLQAVVD